MFTGCHFAILFLKEHKLSDILIFIGIPYLVSKKS